jgi:hypothetical protein
MSPVADTSLSSSVVPASKTALWTGRVLTILTILFLAFDAFGKFAKPVQVTDAFAHLGLPISTSVTIGVVLTVCTILYAIPQTAILGAVLLTGFLGGAVCIQLRVANPPFETLFPVIFGIVMWAGIYLRDPELRRLMPIRR